MYYPQMNNQFDAYASYPTQGQQLHVPYAAGANVPSNGPIPMSGQPGQVSPDGMLPLEQSYIENILRFNRGKPATFYMTFENNPEWNARVFRGVIEEAGRDHIIISNEQTGEYFLLLMVNLDYVEFDQPIEYVPQPGIPSAPQR